MNKKQLLIRSGNAALAAVLGLSPVTSMIQPLVVQAEETASTVETRTAADRTLENVGGDNDVNLADELGTAKYFTFNATVTLLDFEEGQQSAAIGFADNWANVHGKNANDPARMWGNGFGGDIHMPTPTWLADKGIDLSQSFTMTLSVGLDNVVHYYINSIEVGTATLGAGYNPEFYS